MKNPYEVLGVTRDTDIDEIKKTYRRKAKKYHPDLNPNDEVAAEKFKELSEAYAILSDEEKRRMYDTYGEAAFEQGGMGGYNVDMGNMGDIFGDIFGDLFGTRRRANPNAPRKGADARVELRLSFNEAVFGTTKKISITREENCEHCHGTGAKAGTHPKTCPTCGGSGVVNREVNSMFGRMINQTTCPTCGGKGTVIDEPCTHCHGTGRVRRKKTISVNIPAGVADGNIVPMRGEGNSGRNGGPNGDLYIVLNVEPSPLFERRGNDIYYELPISFAQAALGDEVEVATLKGETSFKIPAGTQPGQRFKLAGEGVPYVNSTRKGDLYFFVKIDVPKRLSEEQKKALRQFAETMGEEVSESKKNFFDKVKEIFEG